jgi:2-aminoadipate transaminase
MTDDRVTGVEEARSMGADGARYESRYSHRAAGAVSSVMRDLMALTERPEVISLAGGLPDTQSFPREVFDEVGAVIAREHMASTLQYGPTEGLLDLRERICDVMAQEGATAHPDGVMVTTGGQQAIDLTFSTFLDPGDTVLAEGPTYPGAVPTFTTHQARVVHVPMDADGLRVDLLEETLDRLAEEGTRPKLLYTIPNFQNPAGVTMSRERRERLIRLAHGRELLVVEDNPYGQVRFEGEPLPTLFELDGGAGWVVYLSTFSKILAPGLRVGWVAAPAPVLRKLNLGKQAGDLCSSTYAQRFVLEYLRRFDYREHVGRLNRIYRSRRDAMLDALRDEFPAEATWSRPKGGLFVWATLPEFIDTRELLVRAMERHSVAFVPGAGAFLDGRGRTAMRLNFSGVREEVIREGVERIGSAIGEMVELQKMFGGGL